MNTDRLKFRVVTTDGQVHYPCSHSPMEKCTCTGFLINQNGSLLSNHCKDGLAWARIGFNIDRIELCIGIKDANDDLVYEGDRVVMQVDARGTIHHGKIIWKDGLFSIHVEEDDSYHFCHWGQFALMDVEILHYPHVNKYEDGWFFWDETLSEKYGPFESQEKAREELDKYCETL